MAYVALRHNRPWSNKHNPAAIAPDCVAHASSNMSAVKRAKEIAADTTENVVGATGVGDGRACLSSLTRSNNSRSRSGALPVFVESAPHAQTSWSCEQLGPSRGPATLQLPCARHRCGCRISRRPFRASAQFRVRYFFQSAPSTKPTTAAPASVVMGCSLSDFSTKGLNCRAASCAFLPHSRAALPRQRTISWALSPDPLSRSIVVSA
jgi:hypothetical protein